MVHLHPPLLECTLVLPIKAKLILFPGISTQPSSDEVSENCSRFRDPKLLCQQEDDSVQAFWGEAYGRCQIKLGHIKKCKECRERFLNPPVDLSEVSVVTGSHDN